MAYRPRRALFWQVYPTLLISLILVAVLGAVVSRLFGDPILGPPPHPMEHPLEHALGRHHRRVLMHLHGMGMLLLVAAMVGAAAYPVVRRITRRLERLRLSVEAWGAGDASRRAAMDGDDEISAVAASFNAAADRADALLGAHRALLAHASHELRSPLTRLALAVEMAASTGDGGDFASAARREIRELDALVEEILLASRLEHGADMGADERVDLLALAAEEAARAGVVLAEVAQEGEAFDVRGSPRLLRRLIRNLIDNALKHGAGPVEVSLARQGGRVAVTVRDHGPGIAEDLRGRIFEPFFRPQGWTESAGSWGLGLSLVRQIAERHGGEATCGRVGDQTEFTAWLPALGTGG